MRGTPKEKDYSKLPAEGYIRLDHFRSILGGMSRGSFYSLVRGGKIRKPDMLSARMPAWPVEAVREALAAVAAGKWDVKEKRPWLRNSGGHAKEDSVEAV